MLKIAEISLPLDGGEEAHIPPALPGPAGDDLPVIPGAVLVAAAEAPAGKLAGNPLKFINVHSKDLPAL